MTGLLDVAPYLVAGWVLIVSLGGVATSRDLVHMVMCLSVMQTSAHVLLLAVGHQADATAPIFDEVATGAAVVDPTVQAIAVTDIVVSGGVIGLLLALIVQVHKLHASLDPADLISWRG